MTVDGAAIDTSEVAALARDAADPLADYRTRFHLPLGADGRPKAYFAGQSLGLSLDYQRAVRGQRLGMGCAPLADDRQPQPGVFAAGTVHCRLAALPGRRRRLEEAHGGV